MISKKERLTVNTIAIGFACLLGYCTYPTQADPVGIPERNAAAHAALAQDEDSTSPTVLKARIKAVGQALRKTQDELNQTRIQTANIGGILRGEVNEAGKRMDNIEARLAAVEAKLGLKPPAPAKAQPQTKQPAR